MIRLTAEDDYSQPHLRLSPPLPPHNHFIISRHLLVMEHTDRIPAESRSSSPDPRPTSRYQTTPCLGDGCQKRQSQQVYLKTTLPNSHKIHF
jgi:hypothetical protein